MRSFLLSGRLHFHKFRFNVHMGYFILGYFISTIQGTMYGLSFIYESDCIIP